MTQYNSLNVKLSYSQLNKLRSAMQNDQLILNYQKLNCLNSTIRRVSWPNFLHHYLKLDYL